MQRQVLPAQPENIGYGLGPGTLARRAGPGSRGGRKITNVSVSVNFNPGFNPVFWHESSISQTRALSTNVSTALD
jgi:hypothetical protein